VNILFLCHRFPYPPDQGGKIRPFHMIRHLARANDVTVATLVRSTLEAAAAPELRHQAGCALLVARVHALAVVARVLSTALSGSPASMGYFHSPRLARMIRNELERGRYDAIVVHCSSMAPYVASAAVPKVLDFGDMDSQKWLAYAGERRPPLSFAYRFEGRKLERAERNLAAQFDLCTCTTRAELETLRQLGGARRSDWIPNGVDGEYFRPAVEPYDPELLCFLGRMDYYPNADAVEGFCRETLPLVRARRPGVKLVIIGAEPSRRVRALAGIAGVTVTGRVRDVRPYAQRAAVSIAPLRIARGTQNKILESLAMGIPVVASALAAGGVDAVPGEHLMTATAPGEFAEAVLGLLENPEARARFAAAGRARVLSHHDWRASMRKLDDLLAQCVPHAATAARPEV
jgi:sugar transferase (PEP-CTERM/EpsH1 system associated)